MTDNREVWFSPQVQSRIAGGHVFSGGALYNIGRDVQGSITHLASADGTLLQEYSYDPWGRQRNPGTHAFATYGPLPSGDDEEEESRTATTVTIPVLHRGYCGHEHLEQFGLINMNARLYDPFTGRFYSPDPYVQMPDFSQSFNRYAYCLNNPLKFKDQNGDIFTWNISTSSISIGFNFAILGVPIGFGVTIASLDGSPTLGLYGEIGPHIGGSVLGAGNEINITIRETYFFGEKHNSTTTIGASFTFGIFNAMISGSYSTNISDHTRGSFLFTASASVVMVDPLKCSIDYRYKYDFDKDESEQSFSIGVSASIKSSDKRILGSFNLSAKGAYYWSDNSSQFAIEGGVAYSGVQKTSILPKYTFDEKYSKKHLWDTMINNSIDFSAYKKYIWNKFIKDPKKKLRIVLL